MNAIIQLTPSDFRKSRPRPCLVKRGNVSLKIYPCAKGYIVPWYDAYGRRRLAMRSRREAALEFAATKAEELGLGSVKLQRFKDNLSDADLSEYIWSIEQCNAAGYSLKRAIQEWADQRAKNQGAKFVHKTCPCIVAELLQAKRAAKAGVRWINDLESRLNRFAGAFTGTLAAVTADDIRTWLVRLKLGDRSWNNNRTALIALVKFAKEARYLPPEWDEITAIKPFKIEKGEEQLYTPEEMRSLLFTAEKHYPQHLPALAIMAFAGCRHSELRDETAALDWADVHLDQSRIRIRDSVAKSNTGRRYVPMQPNLVAWLEPYLRPRGPVCPASNLTNAFARLAKKAGVTWKKNALRNSFISYRCAITKNIAQVASEAGNSVREIDDSYRQEIPEEEALRWFGIVPTKADVLPLFAHAKLLGSC